MKRRYKGFLFFAEEDMKSAKVLFKEEIYNQVCFHCQQVSEKSLKAYIKFKRKIVPKVHNLLELLNICIQCNKSFNTFLEECKFLDKFYIPTRYPEAIVGSLPEGLPTKEDAEKAIKYAEEIFSFVKNKLKCMK